MGVKQLKRWYSNQSAITQAVIGFLAGYTSIFIIRYTIFTRWV